MGRVEALCNRNLMNEDFLQHDAWVKQIDAQALATRCADGNKARGRNAHPWLTVEGRVEPDEDAVDAGSGFQVGDGEAVVAFRSLGERCLIS